MLVTPSLGLAKVKVSKKTIFYSVYGLNGNEIRNSMNSKRSGSYDAYTKWDIKWNYKWKNAGDKCKTSSLDVSIFVSYTLPKWKDEDKAGIDVKKKWSAYYKALLKHEQGHAKIGLKAANEIENILLSLRADCYSFENIANAKAKAIIKKYGKIEDEYDRSTNHGMKNGAVFP